MLDHHCRLSKPRFAAACCHFVAEPPTPVTMWQTDMWTDHKTHSITCGTWNDIKMEHPTAAPGKQICTRTPKHHQQVKHKISKQIHADCVANCALRCKLQIALFFQMVVLTKVIETCVPLLWLLESS